MKNKRSMSEFRIKKGTAAKGVIIEGFANKAVVDRVGDLIPGKAWELENFKKNPIIFFNHDRNLPIGKAISVEATDEGLKIKVRISKSNEAPIPYIRDMIKEGIVKTFSVGFDDHGSFAKNEDGHFVPERAELLENSVVTLPMNQDSSFDLTKAISGSCSTWNTKSYHEAKTDVLRLKGAWVSCMVQDAIEELSKDVAFDKEEFFKNIALNSHLTFEQLMDVFTGNMKDIEESILEILAESLSLDLDKLKEQNARQNEIKEADEEEEEEEDEEEEEKQEDDKGVHDEEEEEEEEDDEEEDEKDLTVRFEKGSFQELVATEIVKLIKEGTNKDEAVSAAIITHAKDVTISAEDYGHFFDLADCQNKADASDSVSIDADLENEVNFSNPTIDLQKAQLAMAGSQVQLLREIKNELRMLNAKADSEPEPVGEEIEIDAGDDESGESEAGKALDRRKEMLDAFSKRLDKLKV